MGHFQFTALSSASEPVGCNSTAICKTSSSNSTGHPRISRTLTESNHLRYSYLLVHSARVYYATAIALAPSLNSFQRNTDFIISSLLFDIPETSGVAAPDNYRDKSILCDFGGNTARVVRNRDEEQATFYTRTIVPHSEEIKVTGVCTPCTCHGISRHQVATTNDGKEPWSRLGRGTCGVQLSEKPSLRCFAGNNICCARHTLLHH